MIKLHFFEKKYLCRTKYILLLAIVFLSFSFRSSHQRYSVKKGVFRTLRTLFSQNTSGRLLLFLAIRMTSYYVKVTWWCHTFYCGITEKLWHRCFPVDFAKYLRTPFLQNTSRRVLLETKECLFKKLVSPFRGELWHVCHVGKQKASQTWELTDIVEQTMGL